MNLSADEVRRLAGKYLDGSATREEILLLHQWYDAVNAGEKELILTDEREDEFREHSWVALKQKIAAEKPRRTLLNAGMKWAVAAAVVVAVATGIYYIQHTQQPAVIHPPLADVQSPAGTKAVLTLANGEQIELDSAGKGVLALQTNTKITKNAAGQIIYSGAGNSEEIVYNTIKVPVGSRPISVVLADGTSVWLNAASSLTYPAAFAGKERRVTINGEAYFDVAADATKPFVVARQGSDLTIQVLGTQFNINAYPGAQDARITLLQGAVAVSRKSSGLQARLAAGQQLSAGERFVLDNDPDLDAVVAWKNNLFIFESTDIQTLMREAERWYGITTQYPHGIPAEHFTGSISRDVSLSEFLKILSYSGVSAKIDGKKVFINP
ncbi:FecR domain-containing protein [Chitinophaga sp. 212800010-3]|uniref:FecR family protein n=1 Tax=unclassified Chitinophaga TaxID=2619133 RepID=UPI002DF026D7|nr:FecR family protein [Chitinophaga sp. 212800010-3]